MTLAGVIYKSFRGTTGGAEHFISVVPEGEGDLAQQIADVELRYSMTLHGMGLKEDTAVFRRLFASDVINQAETLRSSSLYRTTPDEPAAVSLVQQPPLPGRKVALLAYHLDAATPYEKERLSANAVLVRKNDHRHLWVTGLCSKQNEPEIAPFEQTRNVFSDLIGTLSLQGASLRDHCLRTWLFIKDVDAFYAGMVEGRAAVFAGQGMAGNAHYIASTGIEGACADRYDLVAMDAYSNLDVQPRQVTFLNDYDKLCKASDYNVHFERGTRVSYSDRSHLFISGTASVDRNGQVVHEGSALRQFERALLNVEGLLKAGDANLSDLMHLIVYLRDPSDYSRIHARLSEILPGLPVVIVQGAVCRPQWLVEIEGIAVVPNQDPALPQF